MTEKKDLAKDSGDNSRNLFGTFGGVFTPSILTILGVIMFMRGGFVVGVAGVYHALFILLIAKSITLFTSLSIGAISTNTHVRGGGAYFLISRSLGPEFGGAIGIALFLALALSVPFYVLGFTEALVRTFPGVAPQFQLIALATGALLFIVAYLGAGGAIKIQYVIMGILALAIVAFLGGAALRFSGETLRDNLAPDYGFDSGKGASAVPYSFWIVFAIYFPAVTGIDAGVNMSGDLKNPAQSIPRGTLAAVGVGFLVYLAQIVICGGAFERSTLIENPYSSLAENALFGAGFIVAAGVFAATLSSAIGSYLGAPRVLQAVSRDPILSFLRPFAKGTEKGDEPRRALVLVGLLTFGVLLWAGNGEGGGALNAMAAIITMFFLYSYGMINLAAFIEAFGDNPSFRPRFRFFHWSVALLGAVGCVVVAFRIHWTAALVAVLLIVSLYWYIRTQGLRATFGDARKGFVYASIRRSLLRLETMPDDPKNWRPTILLFLGNPETRETLARFAGFFESGRGFLILADVLVGPLKDFAPRRDAQIRHLQEFCQEKNLQAFPEVAVAESVDSGIAMLLQTASVGPIKPNLAIFGWPVGERVAAIAEHCRYASAFGMSVVFLRDGGTPWGAGGKRIDLWWRGKANGELMVLLAHLMRRSYEWENAEIRILRLIEKEEGRHPANKAMAELLDEARVKASVQIVVSDRPFVEILHGHSSDASCVILGFEIPDEGAESKWHGLYESFLEDMPTTIIVHSFGEEDILA